MNRKLMVTVCAVALSVLIMGRSVFASVAVPLFPYMPPTDVQLFDIMFNAFGMTKPDIDDDVKRLEGYWKLLEMVAGASAQATREIVQRVFDNAKTSREITINPDTFDVFKQIAKEALNDGVQYKVSEGYTTETEIYNQLQEWQYFNTQRLPASTWAQYYAIFNNRFGFGNWKAVAVYAQYGVSFQIALGAVPKNYNMVFKAPFGVGGTEYSAGWFRDGQSSYYDCMYYQYQGNTAWGDTGWSALFQDRVVATTNSYTGNIADGIQLGAVYATVVPVAQNNDVASAINAEILIPITADTIVENGVIDDTEPFKLRLPADLPVPAETVADLPAVQEKLGVVPISDDIADTVQTLKDALTAEYGDTAEYSLDLTSYFPFCIPFDLGRLFEAFVADPVAPVVPFTFPVGYKDGEIKMQTFYLDLGQFDSVAYWCRKGELLLFIVGLGVVTRQWFLRG